MTLFLSLVVDKWPTLLNWWCYLNSKSKGAVLIVTLNLIPLGEQCHCRVV